MDGFKAINDEHGHGEGDLALRAVADVLRSTVREGDLAARLGGDEFVVYATGAATTDEGEALASRLRERLARANEAAAREGRPYTLGFSIGVAAVEGGDDLDAVLTRADAALYARKLARRARAAGDR
jgi:diguanylate cyclase (GGDEF)-like protein